MRLVPAQQHMGCCHSRVRRTGKHASSADHDSEGCLPCADPTAGCSRFCKSPSRHAAFLMIRLYSMQGCLSLPLTCCFWSYTGSSATTWSASEVLYDSLAQSSGSKEQPPADLAQSRSKLMGDSSMHPEGAMHTMQTESTAPLCFQKAGI